MSESNNLYVGDGYLFRCLAITCDYPYSHVAIYDDHKFIRELPVNPYGWVFLPSDCNHLNTFYRYYPTMHEDAVKEYEREIEQCEERMKEYEEWIKRCREEIEKYKEMIKLNEDWEKEIKPYKRLLKTHEELEAGGEEYEER